MSDRSAFLSRILAEPMADGPRLVFADWLDERGDPRGEFIRLQCALARIPADDSAREQLARREKYLTDQHAGEWTGPFAGKAARCSFRRGFVEAVTLPAERFILHGAELLNAEPVRVVRLSDVAETIDALAGCPALTRVVDLDLTGNELADENLARLLESPARAHWHALLLGANGLTDRTVSRLAGLKPTRLARLDLSYNHVRDPGPLAGIPTLADLDVGHNEIRSPGTLTRRKWARLTLAGNPLGDRGVAALLQTPELFRLRRLDLSRCELSAAVVATVALTPGSDRLEHVSFNENDLGDSGATAIANAPLPNLHTLGLAANGITDQGARSLADGSLFPQLRRLDLRGNRLSATGSSALWNSPRRGADLRLDLADNTPPPGHPYSNDDDEPLGLICTQ